MKIRKFISNSKNFEVTLVRLDDGKMMVVLTKTYRNPNPITALLIQT